MASLSRKGFQREDTHHHVFHLLVDGKRSSIRTHISHGVPEYGDTLLSQVKKQMRLSKRQLEDFINCPLSEQAYREILIEQGDIPAPIAVAEE